MVEDQCVLKDDLKDATPDDLKTTVTDFNGGSETTWPDSSPDSVFPEGFLDPLGERVVR